MFKRCLLNWCMDSSCGRLLPKGAMRDFHISSLFLKENPGYPAWSTPRWGYKETPSLTLEWRQLMSKLFVPFHSSPRGNKQTCREREEPSSYWPHPENTFCSFEWEMPAGATERAGEEPVFLRRWTTPWFSGRSCLRKNVAEKLLHCRSSPISRISKTCHLFLKTSQPGGRGRHTNQTLQYNVVSAPI